MLIADELIHTSDFDQQERFVYALKQIESSIQDASHSLRELAMDFALLKKNLEYLKKQVENARK